MEDRNIEIYKAYCDIITEPSFAEYLMNYYYSNCSIFEDTDENKLEYTQIF